MKQSKIRLSPLILVISLILASGLCSQSLKTPYSRENQLNINSASFEDILKLPISEELAEKLYQRIQFSGPFTSIYELNTIEGIDQQLFLQLKPLIWIEPYAPKSEREERVEALYYKLDRWAGDESTNQALIDLWIEQALEPVDINTIRYDQLNNLQGVSPVDAAAIVQYRSRVGQISGLRDLRSAPYLSYYGYRNARDFISFEPGPAPREFHGNLLIRAHNTPFLAEEGEATEAISTPLVGVVNNYPDVYTRFMGTWGKNIRVGISHWSALGEPLFKTDLGFVEVPSPKFYLGLENQRWGELELRKVYIGNYTLAFGQGVVMDNTDFFTPRKTGFGFRKRFLGLSGDNSRTRQYKLSGAATQLAWRNFDLFLFGSLDNRDAILNTEPVILKGEIHYPVNQLIVLDQRFEYAPLDESRQDLALSWRDAVKELMYGFHAAFKFRPGTSLGITYYESAYDRLLRPDITQIVAPENLGQITLPDNEIYNSYGGEISDSENPFWSNANSFRRIYGMDFQTVIQNVAFQAEYAELDKGSFLNKNPHAFVGSAYVQYNSFDLLGLYRYYALGFDNPYQRSTSNYRRFKRTIYEDYFYLQDPLYGQLYTNNPQPQAEEGFYIRSRYQASRKFVLTLEYDTWLRKSDDASQYRVVGIVSYRPIFPLTIDLRQKYQGREVQNQISVEYFENLEFRGQIRLRLSRFDELGFLYSSSVTKFRPRPRLFYPTQSGIEYDEVNIAGNVASPGEVLGGFFTHNFNEWLKVRGYLGFYKGFYWTFEDTQFLVLDSNRGAMRYWLSVYSRVSNNLSVRIKYTRDHQYPISYIQTRTTSNEPYQSDLGYTRANLIQRVMDFYYIEMNFHF